MGLMKAGLVTKIIHAEGIAFVKENDTHTEWIMFLDDLGYSDLKALKSHDSITFVPDPQASQFIVMDPQIITQNYRKAV